ncbi:MAG: V-type ATP synthase subunit A [Bacteroidia bacterium]
MKAAKGKIIAITGSTIAVETEGDVLQNETGYVLYNGRRLLCEIIKIKGVIAYAQVYESTRGLYFGCEVIFTGKLLSIRLGPGLIGKVFDGLQNDLYKREGTFLQPGDHSPALHDDITFEFFPLVEPNEEIEKGQALGFVKEIEFKHYIFAPDTIAKGTIVKYMHQQTKIQQTEKKVAVLLEPNGNEVLVGMIKEWPVREPLKGYKEKQRPNEVLFTGVRAIDILYPIAVGGTAFIPGPFGCGKTVLQQSISKNAKADIIIFAACGERANEITELLHSFTNLKDAETGKSLMERTIIVCNTSNMPVAAREASVYTAITMAEYYRNMGLNVLLLADSTSRWAQALREISNRLEELPGPEAYPMDLPAIIAAFYARAGAVRLNNNKYGSITFIGTVSPAGGNLREPVTESTRKVARCFYSLSQKRADTKRYPAIDPIESYSRYMAYEELEQFFNKHFYVGWNNDITYLINILVKGKEAAEQINILGDDAVPLETHIQFWQGELVDFCLLQQDAFDEIDGRTNADRQKEMVALVKQLLEMSYVFNGYETIAAFFKKRIFLFKQLNYSVFLSENYSNYKKDLLELTPEKQV